MNFNKNLTVGEYNNEVCVMSCAVCDVMCDVRCDTMSYGAECVSCGVVSVMRSVR